MQFRATGVHVAMVTPFTRGGAEVDYDKIAPLAEYLIKAGASGLFVCGTTGEGPLLTAPERKKILEIVVDAVGDKGRIIAQTAGINTAETISLTTHAAECGAHAAAFVTPGYFGYDEAALTQHFSVVAAAASGFPVLLYNIPQCTGNPLSPAYILELAERIDNLVGIKDSAGNMANLTALLARASSDFNVINGTDNYGFQALVAGCTGVVSGPANVVPEVYAALCKAVEAGDMQRGWEQQIRLEQACGIFQYGKLLALFKEGLRIRGIDAGYCRAPQRELTDTERADLQREMEAAGLV
jgi:4-hydroxy-tetrahydrodipicolinate synthase